MYVCVYIYIYIHTYILYDGRAPPPDTPEAQLEQLEAGPGSQSHQYCDKKVATVLFEALRAALRVVFCRLSVFFEALRAHSSCSHLCCSNYGGA